MKNYLLSILFIAISTSAFSQPANYGACIKHKEQIYGVNETQTYPMHSVMKFPQALLVADYLNKTRIGLDQKVMVKKEDLLQDTWSPMLKLFENERMFSYAELLALSLQQSDNNACDILFRQCGAPSEVECFLHELGFGDIHIRKTERQMHECPATSEENNCTPLAIIHLLEWFYQHKEDNEPLRYVWDLMADCKTGEARIPAALPDGAIIVHKTGTGFSINGEASGLNDVGIVILPDGNHFPIAVFTIAPTSEAMIADIAKKLLRTVTEESSKDSSRQTKP